MSIEVQTSYLYAGEERTTDFVSDAHQTSSYTKTIQQTHTATKNQLTDTSLIRTVAQQAGRTRQIVRKSEFTGWDYLQPKPDFNTAQGRPNGD